MMIIYTVSPFFIPASIFIIVSKSSVNWKDAWVEWKISSFFHLHFTLPSFVCCISFLSILFLFLGYHAKDWTLTFDTHTWLELLSQDEEKRKLEMIHLMVKIERKETFWQCWLNQNGVWQCLLKWHWNEIKVMMMDWLYFVSDTWTLDRRS